MRGTSLEGAARGGDIVAAAMRQRRQQLERGVAAIVQPARAAHLGARGCERVGHLVMTVGQ